MPHEITPTRSTRRHAAFQLWLVNVCVGTLVGTLWLVHLPEDISPWLWLYVPFALVSSVATLALVPGALFAAIQLGVRSWRTAAWLTGFIGALFLSVLYTDTIIYRLLRYHFNGAVLNVLSTPGSEDAVHLGAKVWWLVVAALAAITALQYSLLRFLIARADAREQAGLPTPLFLRPRVVLMAFLLPVVFVEKSVYAAADITNDSEVKVVSRPIPIYPQMRLSHLIDPEAQMLARLGVLPPDAELAYPIARPKIDPDGARPNIMLLVVDSWRRDMFTPELTPRLSAFAEEGRVFEDHLSGGNGTRYGLFTMLYGLHGSYWPPVLRNRRAPVMLELLEELGYELRVFSSASMNFPEFRDTAWVDMPDRVVDGSRGEFGTGDTLSSERDVMVADYVAEWLDARAARDDERPFFCFVLLDSPHQPYHSPGGPYQPVVEELNYIELATKTDADLVERVFNRYRNAVLHADAVAGRILDAVDAVDETDDTVVLVTGDHGEEFQENGYWGHTSNFSSEQLDVPLFLRGPGIPPGREMRPTSHVDVPCTLLELLGADPAARRDYSLGVNLFEPPDTRVRVVAGWSDVGLLTSSGVFRVPLRAGTGEVEVYDAGWQLEPDVQPRYRAERVSFEELLDDCMRFLSVP